ncbi:hypothetical protein BC833DRAFT_626820 [Globomyces pollinis-pini]|nr:hypothetical protein BC833DRAFT_626820 [Globomyces pollinis-pini]
MKEIEESLHLNGLQLDQGGLLYATIRDPSEYTVQQIWEFESLDIISLVEATPHNHFNPPVIGGDSPAYVVFT